MYHDTGRIHDGIDGTHGTRSAQKYAACVRNSNPITLFLMEYHCKNDEAGLLQISSDPKLASQADRVTELFNVFKDTDALDRVRFGINDLGFWQLRTDEARKLPLVANLTLDNLEF